MRQLTKVKLPVSTLADWPYAVVDKDEWLACIINGDATGIIFPHLLLATSLPAVLLITCYCLLSTAKLITAYWYVCFTRLIIAGSAQFSLPTFVRISSPLAL
jgi:hypothetical protein